MKKIDKKDLFGEWEQIATEHNSEIKPVSETASVYIFTPNGKATYKYIDLKRIITHMDNR